MRDGRLNEGGLHHRAQGSGIIRPKQPQPQPIGVSHPAVADRYVPTIVRAGLAVACPVRTPVYDVS
jgi:hypothetical protein